MKQQVGSEVKKSDPESIDKASPANWGLLSMTLKSGCLRSLYIAACSAAVFSASAQNHVQEQATPPAAADTKQQSRERLQDELNSIFDAPTWRNARWGVLVVDMTTSEVLYERDANKSFMPASNMKLYTTAAATEKLGPDYQYETKIYATGPVTDGVLNGDLVVVGSGDPSISGRYNDLITSSGGFAHMQVNREDWSTTAILQRWVKAVRDAGIQKINGAVIGDDDIFDDRELTSSWSVGYLSDWYAAENSGLAINDNCWDIYITPGDAVGEPAKIHPVLDTRFVKFINNVTTIEPGKSRRREVASGAESTSATAAASESMSTATLLATSQQDEEEPAISFDRDLEKNEVTLSGTIALGARPFKEWGAVRNGTLFAATLFAEHLEQAGVRVSNGAKDIDDLDRVRAEELKTHRGKLVHTHLSPPLFSILAVINKPSQNFYADQLLKTLGASDKDRGTYNDGEEVVKEWLEEEHVNAQTLQMHDGSGLSRMDMVEPQMTVGLLRAMAESPYAEVFEASLPVMGVDGTLRTRLRDTPAHKNVKAKTGTIGMVRSLSGYLTTTQGHRLAFAMMANNYAVPTRLATEAQDAALLKLIAYRSDSDAPASSAAE